MQYEADADAARIKLKLPQGGRPASGDFGFFAAAECTCVKLAAVFCGSET